MRQTFLCTFLSVTAIIVFLPKKCESVIYYFPQLAMKATIKNAGNDRLNVSLEAPIANDLMRDGYMAFGFSSTGGMSGSFIVECIPSTGEIFGSMASGHARPIRASSSHVLEKYGMSTSVSVHRCHAAVSKKAVERSRAVVAAVGLLEKGTLNTLAYHAVREKKSVDKLKRELQLQQSPVA